MLKISNKFVCKIPCIFFSLNISIQSVSLNWKIKYSLNNIYNIIYKSMINKFFKSIKKLKLIKIN